MHMTRIFQKLLWCSIFLIQINIQAFSQIEFWKSLPQLPGQYPSLIMSTPANTIFVATDSGLYRSRNNGETWQSVSSGLPEFRLSEQSIITTMVQAGDDFILVGTNADGGLYRSSDEGETWQKITNPDFREVRSIVRNSKGIMFLEAGCTVEPYGLWRSLDNGENWTEIDCSFDDIGIDELFITPHDVLFAQYVPGAGDGEGMFYRSYDDGENWEFLLHWPRLYASSMAFKADDTILVTGIQPVLPPKDDYSGIWRSTDMGDHWDRIASSFVRNDARSIVVDSSGYLYCSGIISGVYESRDDGESWQQINSGLTNLSAIKLALSHNGYLFAATEGGGLYRSVKKVTRVEQMASDFVARDMLEPTFPNPANTYMIIPFTIQQSGFVAIKLYNSVGQEIEFLASHHFQKGNHQLQLQTDKLASGMYWLKMQTMRSKYIKKIVIIK